MGNNSGKLNLLTLEEAKKKIGEEYIIIEQLFKDKGINDQQMAEAFFGIGVPRQLIRHIRQTLNEPDVLKYEDLLNILAIIKAGSADLKSQLMFKLLQKNGYIHLPTMYNFGIKLGWKEEEKQTVIDFFRSREMPEMKEDDLGLFFITNSNLSIFSWMEKVKNNYIKLDEAEENEKIENRALFANKTSFSSLGDEVEKFILQNKIDNRLVNALKTAYNELVLPKAETKVDSFQKLLQKYKCPDIIIQTLVKEILLDSSLFTFFKIFSVLVIPKLHTERNKFIKQCLSENGLHIKEDMSEEEFLKLCSQNNINSKILENLYLLPLIDFSLSPNSVEEERRCIEFLMENEVSPESYINNKLDKCEGDFAIIRTEFWEKWCQTVGWNNTEPRGSLSSSIKLDVEREKGYQKLISQSMVYPVKCLLIPKKVYRVFKMWYHSSDRTPGNFRKSIIYEVNIPYEHLINSYGIKFAKNNTNFVKKIKDNIVIELEINKLFFTVERRKYEELSEIERDKKASFFSSITEKVKAITKTRTPIFEIYISRKKRILDLYDKICLLLTTPSEATLKKRLFFDDEVVEEQYFEWSLEKYFSMNGNIANIVRIEVAQENGEFFRPSTSIIHQKIQTILYYCLFINIILS